MASKEVWTEAYRLLRKSTPLPVDCGQLCSQRCCSEWDEGVGMYLLPGEECMFTGEETWATWQSHKVEEHDFCPAWTGAIESVPFIMCKGTCPRDSRPFACRSFPLAPHLDVEGNLSLVLDDNGILICPLVQLNDISAISRSFMQNCYKAWKLLIDSDPLIEQDVSFESRRRETQEGNSLRALLGEGDSEQ